MCGSILAVTVCVCVFTGALCIPARLHSSRPAPPHQPVSRRGLHIRWGWVGGCTVLLTGVCGGWLLGETEGEQIAVVYPPNGEWSALECEWCDIEEFYFIVQG